MSNMLMMVVHCSIAYHGLENPHMMVRVYQMYVNHVKQRYSTDVIVFYGYTNEPSTKDATHLRRTGTCSGVTVHFTGDKLIRSKKDDSWHIKKISNSSLTIFTKELEKIGCVVDSAKQDADSADNYCICTNQRYHFSG